MKMEKTKMKKIISFIVLCLFTAMTLTAKPIKIVKTSYEKSLLDNVGITDCSVISDKDWYFSKDGIDKTAKKMVDKLPSNEAVILYGISLGGTVVRRMTQIAEENGKTVKGYIAQSSPLSGDRLTNTAWATTSLAMLGIYTTLLGGTLVLGAPLEEVLCKDLIGQDYDFYAQLDDKSKSIISSYENITKNKTIDRNDEQSIIENVTLPLLDVIFGTDEHRGDMWNYFSSVFSNGDNVKDLDPTGNFMVNVMNSSSEMKKEATDDIKRAFIVSTNGNIYESSAWNKVQPLLSYYQRQRDTYWAKAKKQWWLFAYWSLRAAASSVSVATIEGVPRAWSTCVSGSVDYSTNDGFVPANDKFWGKELKMTAPNMRKDSFDRSYTCDKVSHIDYGESFEDLPNKYGRSYIRAKSVEQQKEAIIQANNFVNP